MIDNLPKVLIVILNYKTYSMTLDIVKKIRELEYQNYDILVVDNHSPNESARVLKEKSNVDNFIFIANDKNSGYAAGNNIGIRYAINNGYDYSWVLNNDLIFNDKKILNVLINKAESEDKIACIGPKITDINGNIVAPYISRPTRWSQTVGMFSEKRKRDKQKLDSGKVYRVYGCCMLLKNSYMN